MLQLALLPYEWFSFSSLSSYMTTCLLLMQRGEVVCVVLWVFSVGNHSDDCALQRSPPQQPLADQVHVPRRVHAESDGGTREEDLFMGQQQRQTARYLNPFVGCHCPVVSETRSLFVARTSPTVKAKRKHRTLPPSTFKISFSLTTRILTPLNTSVKAKRAFKDKVSQIKAVLFCFVFHTNFCTITSPEV